MSLPSKTIILREDRGSHPAGVVGLAVAALVARHAGEDLRRVPAVVAHDPALHQHHHTHTSMSHHHPSAWHWHGH